MNKITYGLENVHYAKVTQVGSNGKITYGPVKKFPGAIELSLEAKGEILEVPADNIIYYASQTNQGYEGKFTCAEIPEDFLTEILGETKDSKNVLTEKSDATKAEFALMFQFQGDVKNVRHVMYNCTAGRSGISSQTKDGNNVNKLEIPIKALPRPEDKVIKRKTTTETDSNVYDTWFTKPYEPEA